MQTVFLPTRTSKLMVTALFRPRTRSRRTGVPELSRGAPVGPSGCQENGNVRTD